MVVPQVDLMSRSDSELLGIGAVAELSGKRASAIRYYEEIGLLPAPRRIDDRRVYEPAIVRTLAVIDTAQRAGLSLDEIRSLLQASADGGNAIEELRAIAARKLPEVIALIERSRLVRSWLERAARCECPTFDDCPLFDSEAAP
jgi:MerR family redox-sensitive transcriptional activator SoxR